MCQLEFGIAWKVILTPFNCRTVANNMLSVEEEYRRPPEHRLHMGLTLALWPEVLTEPINLHKNSSGRSDERKGAKFRIKPLLRKTHLWRFLPKAVRRVEGELCDG